MKTTCLIILFLSSLVNPTLEKSLIYTALSGNSLENVNKLIKELGEVKSSPTIRAYQGALMAKKASFKKNIQEKVKYFKAGAQLLENEIKVSPNHAEHRFLRLCIQEHCPPVLKYNKNIAEDALLITSTYRKQSKALKRIIFDYAKNSNAIDQTLLK